MHCRVVEGSVSAQSLDQALEAMKGLVLPKLKEIPGFAGAYWFADRIGGRLVATTFYDSKQSLESSRSQAEQIRTAGLQAGGVKFDAVSEYEVIADTGEKVSNTASHARLTSSTGDPSRVDETIEMIHNTVIPSAKQIPGFNGGFWLANRATGDGIAATLWESEDAVASSRGPATGIREKASSQVALQIKDVSEYAIVARVETPVAAGKTA
jgi:heme-degrading monooxygenase HmoA